MGDYANFMKIGEIMHELNLTEKEILEWILLENIELSIVLSSEYKLCDQQTEGIILSIYKHPSFDDVEKLTEYIHSFERFISHIIYGESISDPDIIEDYFSPKDKILKIYKSLQEKGHYSYFIDISKATRLVFVFENLIPENLFQKKIAPLELEFSKLKFYWDKTRSSFAHFSYITEPYQYIPSEGEIRTETFKVWLYIENDYICYAVSVGQILDITSYRGNLNNELSPQEISLIKTKLASNQLTNEQKKFISQIVEKLSPPILYYQITHAWISSSTFEFLPSSEKMKWQFEEESGNYICPLNLNFKDLFVSESDAYKLIHLKMLRQNVSEGYRAYCKYKEDLKKEPKFYKILNLYDYYRDDLTKQLIHESFNHYDLTPNFYTYDELVIRWAKLDQPKSSIEDAVVNKNALVPYYRPNSKLLKASREISICSENLISYLSSERVNYKKRYEGYEVLGYEIVQEIFQNRRYEALETYFKQTEFERYINYYRWAELKEISISELHFSVEEVEAYEKENFFKKKTTPKRERATEKQKKEREAQLKDALKWLQNQAQKKKITFDKKDIFCDKNAFKEFLNKRYKDSFYLSKDGLKSYFKSMGMKFAAGKMTPQRKEKWEKLIAE